MFFIPRWGHCLFLGSGQSVTKCVVKAIVARVVKKIKWLTGKLTLNQGSVATELDSRCFKVMDSPKRNGTFLRGSTILNNCIFPS